MDVKLQNIETTLKINYDANYDAHNYRWNWKGKLSTRLFSNGILRANCPQGDFLFDILFHFEILIDNLPTTYDVIFTSFEET